MTNKSHDDHIPPELERYLALCQRAYDRMVQTGEWPWSDSPDFEDVIDSDDNDKGV